MKSFIIFVLLTQRKIIFDKYVMNMDKLSLKHKTLNQFVIEAVKNNVPSREYGLPPLIHAISVAGKIINKEISRAGMADMMGISGSANVHGEEVKKLDEYAHDVFVAALTVSGECCVIVSEESEDIIALQNKIDDAKYVVLIDPIDGSSNADVNVSIGTIFSIYKRTTTSGPGTVEDCLQKGLEQISAGYIIYGSSTIFVLTTGDGVHGFTLDTSVGEFYYSHPYLTIPSMGKFYSINEGNYQKFDIGIRKFIDYCQEEKSVSDNPYVSRHIGSLVADFHRNLIKGGVFIYPASTQHPNGKLRLLYECNPMAFLMEQAGGKATNGVQRLLELDVTHIHQLSPIVIGSTDMVEKVEQFIKDYSPVLNHHKV